MTNKLGCLKAGHLYEATHRRRHPLLDEAGQRAREQHLEADRVDRPTHDVERARPGMFSCGADAEPGRGGSSAEHGRGSAITEESRRNYVRFGSTIDAARER